MNENRELADGRGTADGPQVRLGPGQADLIQCQHGSDAGLDELLATAMDGMLAKLEAGFDPDAGLAGIYARLAEADSPRHVPAHDQADMLDADQENR